LKRQKTNKKLSPTKATNNDIKEWLNFTRENNRVYDKDSVLLKENNSFNQTRKLDLHGLSLNEANKVIKKFIIKSFEEKYKKLLIITGKGLRSNVAQDPYISEHFNVLKNSVPEFINNDVDLIKKIKKTSKANLKDGGEGAFYIFLK